MKEVRVGIIGAGMISHRHMTIYTHIPNAKVVAVSEIDENRLMITDGLFLSSELGREVTADEIRAMSKPLSLTEPETPFGTIHYDLSF